MTDQNFTAVHISGPSRGFCAPLPRRRSSGSSCVIVSASNATWQPAACGKDPTYQRRRSRRPNTSFGLLTGGATFGVHLTSAMRSREDEPRHGSRACPRVSPREAWATPYTSQIPAMTGPSVRGLRCGKARRSLHADSAFTDGRQRAAHYRHRVAGFGCSWAVSPDGARRLAPGFPLTLVDMGKLLFSSMTQSSVVACRSSLSVEAGPGSTRNQT